jgi:hypothetical protein
MKLQRYNQFIKENLQDTPEEYIKTALLQIKKKIEYLFDKKEVGDEGLEAAKKRGEEKAKEGEQMSLKDLKVSLESSEISTFSSLNDNVVIKFTDEKYLYDLTIFIPLENGISKDKSKDFSSDDIKECSVKFKKYDVETFDLIGQIGPKKVKIEDINEDFIVNLKIELDDKFGEEEKLEIETN